jgi:hypothetical protein
MTNDQFIYFCKKFKIKDNKSKVLYQILTNPYRTTEEISDRTGLKYTTVVYNLSALYYKFEAKGKFHLREIINGLLNDNK